MKQHCIHIYSGITAVERASDNEEKCSGTRSEQRQDNGHLVQHDKPITKRDKKKETLSLIIHCVCMGIDQYLTILPGLQVTMALSTVVAKTGVSLGCNLYIPLYIGLYSDTVVMFCNVILLC